MSLDFAFGTLALFEFQPEVPPLLFFVQSRGYRGYGRAQAPAGSGARALGEAEEVSWCQAAPEETRRATLFGQRWPVLMHRWLGREQLVHGVHSAMTVVVPTQTTSGGCVRLCWLGH